MTEGDIMTRGKNLPGAEAQGRMARRHCYGLDEINPFDVLTISWPNENNSNLRRSFRKGWEDEDREGNAPNRSKAI